MKNVIFWVGVKNQTYSEKYGGWEWMDISRKTWEYWCEKHDVIFFPFEKPIDQDLIKYRINWQKSIYCFDLLDQAGIDYDQIFLVDATCMAKWDMPNVFELTDHKFTAWRETDNLNWVYDSIVGYEDFFSYKLNRHDYFSSGVIIFNKSHKDIFLGFKDLYLNNVDKFVKLQDTIVRKGTEQTPLNYWVQKNGVELNLDLPFSYKLTHIHRKDMFGHNWQLNEDKTPLFIKHAYNWVFTGIPKDQRTSLMSQTWELVKDNYTLDDTEFLLNSVNHKDTFKNATSRKFKKDLIEFFSDDKYKDMSLVEHGACHGDTTKIFSSIFKKVYAYDWAQENVDRITEKCKGCDNVEVTVMDVVKDEWKFPEAQVVFVDASHDYPQVAIDIQKTLDYFDNPIIIMDDYGNPNNRNIRVSIDEKIKEGKIKIHKKIGEDVGYKTKAGWEMIDREGVILC